MGHLRIRDLNRLELAGESVRAALEGLAAAAPGWLAGVIDASWQQRYGQRIDSLRLPTSQAKRKELAARYGRDGYRLLEAAYGRAAPGWLREVPAVAALRQIWVQQYYRVIDERGERVIWRETAEHGLPPGRTAIVSLVVSPLAPALAEAHPVRGVLAGRQAGQREWF
jgi:hypothetical protein